MSGEMTQDIYPLDPERITDRIFGGPHFLKLKVVQTSPLICKHPISGRVYTMDEIGVASWESRNAMTLDEAIAEVKRVTTDSVPWVGGDFCCIVPKDTRTALAAILNAVASGELVKSGWQPIATAPRDGTKVDLWMVNQDGRAWREADAYYVTQRDDAVYEHVPEQCVVHVSYAPRDGWCAPNHDYDGFDGWCDEPEHFVLSQGRIDFTLPTHWMPLPQPPALADHGPTAPGQIDG